MDGDLTEVGLRELRQNASELVRRAQEGERMMITVAGRPAAVLGPVGDKTWRRWAEVEAVFASATDPAWAADRDRLDGDVVDPWERR
ncbi:type II toxin-antitoxin system Phd/YefM family antitoxin [Actinophytocola sp.]|uniref:type II toxin-antitoxin system Phd/YefM family antitoxin n=1 Tax=Actinophytocola sp. TaxID=1872138 RepID=UPI00389A76BE